MKQVLQIGAIILISCLAFSVGVQEKTFQKGEEKGFEDIINQHVKKTISTKLGEVFDCVDIDRQPAFDHSLLKNHKLQMKPSSYPAGFHFVSSSAANRTRAQLTMVACPVGTIPILRRNEKVGSIPMLSPSPVGAGEIAGIKTEGDIYGARVSLNIYEPKVKGDRDYSSQLFNVMHREDGPLEAIAAGSMVSRAFGDSFARFHILWLDNYKQSCMDFQCPGFVQISEHIGIGGRITPVSTYKGKQVEIHLLLFQDPRTKDWWLFYDSNAIGYWPSSLFTKLKDKANIALFAGYTWGPTIQQDPPEMGSGHYAGEGEGKAAYARDVKIVDSSNKLADLDFDKSFAYSTKPPCYTVDSYDHNSDGAHVYYGGPGGCHPR